MSTGQDFTGYNMFAYCGNNPAFNVDPFGTRHEISTGGVGRRDVTDEVLSALHEECNRIKQYQLWRSAVLSVPFFTPNLTQLSIETGLDCLVFYTRVNHGAPWDIKLRESWEETIGTRFPGKFCYVFFDGILMTPEMLGNFTYGYLGYMYDFSLSPLYAGSFYAAGFPTEKEKLDNELWDWEWITQGYYYALTHD